MAKLRCFLQYWLPVVLWCALIVAASGDTKSVHRSSRIIEPLLRWLFPDLSEEVLWHVVFLARKWAHLFTYGVLALLLWRGLRATFWTQMTVWSRRCAHTAWALATAYAVTDEIHQTFVPGRQGAVLDVIIDSAGAALALFFLWLIRWKWFPRQSETTLSS